MLRYHNYGEPLVICATLSLHNLTVVPMSALKALLPPPSTLPPQPDIKLRPWQQEAFGVYRDCVLRRERTLLLEATPGAGKTTAALVLALHQRNKQGARRIGIVVPTAHLKIQWARAALELNLHLDSSFSSSRGSLTEDYSGFVVTYQQVAQKPELFKRLTQDSCIILDEVHHAGDGLSWGDGLRCAFHEARFIICLSGTPFRSDNSPIPFVTYDDHGFSVPDYSYSYSRAVEDGVCRPTAFFTYAGEVAWREEAGDVRAWFSDELDYIGQSRRLRAALDPASGWIEPMLRDAHEMLVKTRSDHPNAAGLLVAADQTSARRLAKLLSSITKVSPVVILSEEPEAARKLKRFRDSNEPWLVACNMVSEGVDIPRLRVGVYATTVRTKMYFRQFLGRIVRRISSLRALQVAYCYLPADPTLIRLAEEIEDEIRHCIRPRGDDLFDDQRRVAQNDDRPNPPQWEALTSINSGLNSVIVHGNQLSLFGGVQQSEELHQAVTERVAARLDERRTRAEDKAFLVQELRKLVNLHHKRTNKSHAQIHAQLNSIQKVRSQTHCTEKQLRERIDLMRAMLHSA
jgi:superfamily II DNA or RNA helicase